jgi:hypothetical protein
MDKAALQGEAAADEAEHARKRVQGAVREGTWRVVHL